MVAQVLRESWGLGVPQLVGGDQRTMMVVVLGEMKSCDAVQARRVSLVYACGCFLRVGS